MENTARFTTADFGEVGALALNGINATRYSFAGNTCTFVYDGDVSRVTDIIDQYRRGVLTGSLRQFHIETRFIARWARDARKGDSR